MSPVLALRDAVREISHAFRGLDGHGDPDAVDHASRAFFFLVGAGISAPQVPLASAIEADCEERAHKQGLLDGAAPPDDPMGKYAHWLKQAYPQPIHRQHYFRALIERKPISPANLRLAHLLSTGKVPRLVVTPNFDDFLSRALTLFGEAHIVSDHPATARRIDPERTTDIQILHVHGTCWYYDCCNLMGEIDRRATIEPIHQSVASRLDQILAGRSPLVLGYSGWERDVFMTSLKRRLDAGPLAYNLYWFCHRRSDVDAMPDFMRGRDDVCFVLPPDAATSGRDEATGDDAGAGRPSESGERRLAAVSVLDELIRVLDVDVPALTRNPIAFFADHLSTSLLVDASAEDGFTDFYGLESMIRRLKEMSPGWAPESSGEGDGPASAVERVRDSVRRSLYQEAIDQAQHIELESLTAEQLGELQQTIELAAPRVEDLDQTIAASDLIVEIADLLERRGESQGVATALNAMRLKADALHQADRSEDALVVCDGIVDRFAEPAELGGKLALARALRTKAMILDNLGRFESAVDVADDLNGRFATSPDSLLRHVVANSLLGKGFHLALLGADDKAVVVYDELIAFCDRSPNPILNAAIGQALINKSSSLERMRRHDDAIAVCDEAVKRLEDDAAAQTLVAGAFVNKTYCLLMARAPERAIEVCDQVVERFGEHKDPSSRAQVAMAELNRIFALRLMGRPAQAIAACEEVVEWFADIPASANEVLHAELDRADVLAEIGELDRALVVYEETANRVETTEHNDVNGGVALVLMSERDTLLAAGQDEEASRLGGLIDVRIAAAPQKGRAQLIEDRVQRGHDLLVLGRRDRAAALADELAERFAADADPRMRKSLVALERFVAALDA